MAQPREYQGVSAAGGGCASKEPHLQATGKDSLVSMKLREDMICRCQPTKD